MKLIVKTEALVKVLTDAFDVIPVKSTNPLFLNFLLTIKNNTLEVLASDDISTIKVTLSNENEVENIISSEDGAIQVSAKTFLDICRNLSGNTITLDLQENELYVSDGRTSYTLATVRAEEYPDIDFTFDDTKTIEVAYDDFVTLFNSTSFAVATKGAEPHYFGINIRTQGDTLYFLALDGNRLAQKSVQAKVNTNEDIEFISPVKVLSMIAKKSNAKTVHIQLGDGKALFKVENCLYQTRLYNGSFPSVDRLTPKRTPYILKVDSESFLKALDRVILVTQGNYASLARLTAEIDHAELNASTQNVGKAKEELENFSFEGDLFSITFNVKFVAEAIKALNTKEVILAFVGEGNIFLVQNNDPSNVQIITPVRVYSY